MHTGTPTREGFIPFRGFRTWYKIFGDLVGNSSGKAPVLALHGGPGVPHNYLLSLSSLASVGRPVVFYDQLGCGNSDRPDDPDLWTVDLFVEELGIVREALGLDRVHLIGNSWGGMLAMEYLLTRPTGVISAIIGSSPASIPLWVAEANRLRQELPPDVQATLLQHEAAGTTDSAEYQAAITVFYGRHVCRMEPWPQDLLDAFNNMGAQVYNTMNGPSEFHVIGKIKDWNISARLPEIDVPVLITSGRYDECTPMQAEIVHRGIPGSEWVLFENSAHVSHLEEQEMYMGIAETFLQRTETAGA